MRWRGNLLGVEESVEEKQREMNMEEERRETEKEGDGGGQRGLETRKRRVGEAHQPELQNRAKRRRRQSIRPL